MPLSTASDTILGDLRTKDTTNFYYEVWFENTKTGNKYGPKGGSPGNTISFDNVVYDTYDFYLKIYIDKEKDIVLGTQYVLNKTVSETDNTVNFELHLSEYTDFYFVSNQEELSDAFSKIAEKGGIDQNDESTFGKIIVQNDFELSPDRTAPGPVISYSYSDTIGAVVNLCGHKISSESKVSFAGNDEFIVFKDGTLKMNQITLGMAGDSGGTSVLTLDGVSVVQNGDEIGGLIKPYSATVKLTNGTTVQSDELCLYLYGGNVVM
ncbi:MAG: hypothetical protein II921_04780, partial [Treponema sp.]|nr:hypothetical protein [Treponema sp.]